MRVFQQVADVGSFAAAARVLDISPPVVTRLVADLEEHLGTRLLQRSTRRVTLTDAGTLYLHRIRHILQDLEEAEAVTSAHTQALAGLLRVHAPPVLATAVIAPLLAEFRQRYPEVQLEIDVERCDEPPVEDHDITLLGVDGDFDASIVARKVVESEAILVASPVYLARRGMPQRPADLVQHECLQVRLPGRASRHWRLWQPSAPQAVEVVPVRPVLVANHTDTVLRAVLDGAGITSVSTDLVAMHLTRGELVRVLQPWITGRLALYAALPSRKFIPERTRKFLDFLVTHTQQHTATAKALFQAQSCLEHPESS